MLVTWQIPENEEPFLDQSACSKTKNKNKLDLNGFNQITKINYIMDSSIKNLETMQLP